jgi:outer membrane lipoprotein-sorting protein
MKRNNIVRNLMVLLFSVVLLLNSTSLFAQDANSILSKMDKVMFFAKDKQADVKLTIENLKNGKVTVKKAVTYEKGSKTLFRYLFPKADSGITSLTASENETYIYLPLFNMVKKVTNTASVGNLNKSDFALADKPAKSYSDSYKPELVKTIADAYVLKLIPKNEKNPYQYLIVHVDKKNFYPKTIVYYDKKGNKLKTAQYHFTKINNHWVVDKIVMTNNQKESRTTIQMTNIKINQGLPDSMFTKDSLKKKKSK